MTNKQWKAAIEKTVKLYHEYSEAKKEAEDEYISRYNDHPSDNGDELWILLIQHGLGSTDLNEIQRSAELHRNLDK